MGRLAARIRSLEPLLADEDFREYLDALRGWLSGCRAT